MSSNLFVIIFTTIYGFAYREAVRTAAEWGAFRFKAKPFILGKLIWTFVLLIVLPVFFYWLALSVVSRLTVNVASFPSLVIDILARKTPLILLLGLFPRAAKNAWNLVAKRFVTQGTGPGQPGEGWINELKKPENDLPKRSYSKEAVVCLGIIPVLIIVYMILVQKVSLFQEFRREQLTSLFAISYFTELVVLYYRAKTMRFFYSEDWPAHLIEWPRPRTIPTVAVSIILPVAFAILCSPWILWLQDKDTNLCWFLIGMELAVVSLLFPFYCNQALCPFARKGKWAPPEEAPEIYKGPLRFWWLCLILGITNIATLVAVTVARWGLYTSYGEQILRRAETLGK